MKKTKGNTAHSDYIEDNLEKLERVKEADEKEIPEMPEPDEISPDNIANAADAVKKACSVKNLLGSLVINEATEEDEKNKSLYESAKALLKDGILSMVVDDVANISTEAVDAGELPTATGKGGAKYGEVLENAAVVLYAENFFAGYTDGEDKEGLRYELEYIVSGHENDKDNFLSAVEKLAALRNISNMSVLIADKKKMAQISGIAASAATATGIPFLEPVIKAALIEAWSLAESVQDVRTLLDGGKVPLLKKSSEWKTDIKNLTGTKQKQKNKKGLEYKTYLEMLMMSESPGDVLFRIMDLIQINVREEYNDSFLMRDCFSKIDVDVEFCAQPLFTAMPWVVKRMNENGGYKFHIKAGRDFSYGT